MLERVEKLFEQALGVAVDHREEWVRRECAGEPEVCAEVLDLLRARDRVGGFLESPVLDFRGQQLGAYRVMEEVGRGGMSVVYRGERAGGDYDKQVAIKIILLQAAAAVKQSETQILATLEHPHIARLLDAGITPLGFRYLVMDFVEGLPITKYAERLPVRQRLKLFVDVCEAVQYAHRALVVHRDLKPDNILVNAAGEVKLLDFGIAKMLDPEVSGEQTQGVRAFSPNYASPEQLLGQPVTTATDVYSLGVLFCEMLSGRPPRVLADLTLEKMVDLARTEVPPLPLEGDLAAIGQQALRTNPAERYGSAGAFAHDVLRYLQGLPVEAREPTLGYTARKFIGRHRYSVTAATLAAAGLIASTGVAVWQARKADERFNQVRELARSVMFELHDQVSPLAGSLDAQKLIIDRSLHYLDALAADRSAGAEVRLDLAKGYLRLSELEGKDLGGKSLGRSEDALKHAMQAVEIARVLVRKNPAGVEPRRVLVKALDYTTTANIVRGEPARAIPLGEEAVRLAEALVRDQPDSDANQQLLATATKQLADGYAAASKTREKALPLFLRSLEMRKRLFEAKPQDPVRHKEYAEANQWAASAYWDLKDWSNCDRHAREALRLDELRLQSFPAARANVAADALQVAMVSLRLKRPGDAVKYLERVLDLRRQVAAEDPKSATSALRVAAALDRLGIAYREWGKYKEAVQYGTEALAEARRVRRLDLKNAVAGRELAFAISDLALTYQAAGEKAKPCQLARECVELLKAVPAHVSLEPVSEKMNRIAGKCGSDARGQASK